MFLCNCGWKSIKLHVNVALIRTAYSASFIAINHSYILSCQSLPRNKRYRFGTNRVEFYQNKLNVNFKIIYFAIQYCFALKQHLQTVEMFNLHNTCFFLVYGKFTLVMTGSILKVTICECIVWNYWQYNYWSLFFYQEKYLKW